jgi:very-short-patch-repair endonuclease
MGVKLCPCGKVFDICPLHKDAPIIKRPKLHSHKVTDPKSGFYPGSQGHQEWKRQYRDKLRANPTPAERVMIHLLSNDPEWIFQPIVLGFIPDFSHERAKVIVEVDGSVHNTTAGKRADARRDNIFRLEGWIVKRFTNSQVIHQTEDVLAVINATLHARLDGKRKG